MHNRSPVQPPHPWHKGRPDAGQPVMPLVASLIVILAIATVLLYQFGVFTVK
ncbi:MAG: hypothetical protein Q8L64_06065 [bacterium]|nr:hypothetical protein [bacterium]